MSNRSQSAFAGYGLEDSIHHYNETEERVAIRFRWIWVGRQAVISRKSWLQSRNPLSLDMGWKMRRLIPISIMLSSQSAFAGYGLEDEDYNTGYTCWYSRNPLSLDMGWKLQQLKSKVHVKNVAIRFRWIWVGRQEDFIPQIQVLESQSAFAGYGLEGGMNIFLDALKVGRNPLSLDMGWKKGKGEIGGTLLRVAIRFRWIWVGRINHWH